MVSSFLRRLFAPAQTPIPNLDGRVALAALLVRIAKADADYAFEEIHQIDEILAERFGINAVDAAQLRVSGERWEAEATDTVRFTRMLKETVPYEERISLLETLWAVALSDGSREAEEDAVLRLVAPLLGVSDQDSARARQRAQSARAL